MVSNNHTMLNNNIPMAKNRIKVVLVEQERTARWLSEKLQKSENTISRWCSNKIQPSLPQLQEIANVLNVDIRTLIQPISQESAK